MSPMDQERFEQIAWRYKELDEEQIRLHTKRFDLLYNTSANSHHPVAFTSLEAALAHEDLTEKIEELGRAKSMLSFNALHEGLPTGRWIKLEAPDVPDEESTGIVLREYVTGDYELQTEDWSLVLAEG